MRVRLLAFPITLLILVLVGMSAPASAASFSEDVDAIDSAAQSVLMLEVFDSSGKIISTGSGFVAFSNRTIVTNEHVMSGAEWIMGTSDSGNQYMITNAIAVDEKKDIAILEFFSPTDLHPLNLAHDTTIRRAESIVAIGSPLGQKNTVTLGNVSSVLSSEELTLIQFTAPISPGSSGGPLFNSAGDVIGITSSSLTEGQNMNLAVSITEVIGLYNASGSVKSVKISDYAPATVTVTPEPTVTPKPTLKVTVIWKTEKPKPTPTPTKHPQEGEISRFRSGKGFSYSRLKSLKNFLYDEFDKSWGYYTSFEMDKGFRIVCSLRGDDEKLINYPILYINSEDYNGLFVKKLQISVGNIVYEMGAPRYYNNDEVLGNFFYLGASGIEMLKSISTARSVSVRITLENGRVYTEKLDSHQIGRISNWSKDLIRGGVLNAINASVLSWPDTIHSVKLK